MQPQPWPLPSIKQKASPVKCLNTEFLLWAAHRKQTCVIILFLGLTIVIRKLLLAMEYLKHRVLPHSSSPNF